MTEHQWRQEGYTHANRSAELKALAKKLLNTAKSEDIAVRMCEINAKRAAQHGESAKEGQP